MENRYMIINDNDNLLFDIFEIVDDTLIVENISLLQNAKFNTNIYFPDMKNLSLNLTEFNGHKREFDLYDKLLSECEIKFNTTLIRW